MSDPETRSGEGDSEAAAIAAGGGMRIAPPETDPAADPEAALHVVDVDDAVEALDRKGSAIVGLSAVVLVVTIWVLFEASPGPAVGLAVLVLLGLKKAVVEYRELSRKKTKLLAARGGATGGRHPTDG